MALQQAWAQDSSRSDAAAAPSAVEDTLGVIVVTARRRSENLQSVPVAVSALTADSLESRSLTSLKQIEQAAPNVRFQSSPVGGSANAALVYIRGVGQSETLASSDPGVGIYVDGVYLGSMASLDLDTIDIERIEVLRGPQGTLYGKNTIGGAVNIISQLPDLNDVSGHAQATYGTFRRIDLLGSVSLPIVTDRLAVRLGIARRSDDGYGYRQSDGQRLNNQDSYTGRGSLLFKATDRLTFLLTGDYNIYHDKGIAAHAIAYNPAPLIPVGLFQLPFIAATFSNPVPGSPPYGPAYSTSNFYSNYGTGPNYNRGTVWGSALTTTSDLGSATLKSITAYRDQHVRSGQDVDLSPFPINDQQLDLQQNQFSQELQLNANALASRLQYTTGLYYFEERAADFSDYRIISALRVLAPQLDVSYDKPLDVRNHSSAAYGQATYKLTDELSLTTGVRYSKDRKFASTSQTNPYTGAVTFPYTERRTDSSDVSPRVSLDYQWTPTVMTYLSAAKGYKSGGANGRASTIPDAFDVFAPERVWTYEVGLKSDLLDRRARVNLAAFYSDYKDIQVTSTRSGSGANGQVVASYAVVENAAAATIKGLEAEITLLPVRGLTLTGSLGLLDAKYTAVDAGTSLTVNDKLQNVPKWNSNASAEYNVPINAVSLSARVDYSYRSSVEYDLLNSPLAHQAGYGLLNGRLAIRSDQGDGSWTLAVFGTNLTDKRYDLSKVDFFSTLGFVYGFPGRPREFGVSVERRF